MQMYFYWGKLRHTGTELRVKYLVTVESAYDGHVEPPLSDRREATQTIGDDDGREQSQNITLTHLTTFVFRPVNVTFVVFTLDSLAEMADNYLNAPGLVRIT